MNWKDSWFSKRSTLYGCGDKLWIPLIGLWGVVRYTPLLVLRQYGSEQFIPATFRLNHLEFDYGGSSYVNRLTEFSRLWKEHIWMDLGKRVCDIAPDYSVWTLNWVKDLVFPPIDDMV